MKIEALAQLLAFLPNKISKGLFFLNGPFLLTKRDKMLKYNCSNRVNGCSTQWRGKSEHPPFNG